MDICQEFGIHDESVDTNAVLRAMESAGNGLNIVILDARRNNLFACSLIALVIKRVWTRPVRNLHRLCYHVWGDLAGQKRLV